MKARLTPLVLNKDFACALVVEQHLPEYQFQVILVHEIIGARNLVVAIVSDVESRAVAVAGLVGGVDIPASLQQSPILLRPQNARYIESVVRQPVASEDVRPFFAYRLQLRRRFGDELRNWGGQRIDDIVIGILHHHQLPFHARGFLAVGGHAR